MVVEGGGRKRMISKVSGRERERKGQKELSHSLQRVTTDIQLYHREEIHLLKTLQQPDMSPSLHDVNSSDSNNLPTNQIL